MHQFDQDIMLEPAKPNSFLGAITDNWSINGVPNGGYLMAIAAHAMLQCSEMNATPIITANFLNRCEPGAATVSIERMSRSRQFDRFQTRLCQKEKEKIRAFGTFASDKNECILERDEVEAPEITGWQDCVSIPEMPGFTLFGQLDIRLDPICAGWTAGKLSEKSENRGWIKFKDNRAFDTLALLLIADAFPPAVFATQGMVAWVPTLEFSVNIRSIPATAWLKCIFRTRFITCGLLEEDGEIWDQNGQLVAISRQIAQYRSHTQ